MASRHTAQSAARAAQLKANAQELSGNAKARAALLLSQASLQSLNTSHWTAIQQSGLLSQDALDALKSSLRALADESGVDLSNSTCADTAHQNQRPHWQEQTGMFSALTGLRQGQTALEGMTLFDSDLSRPEIPQEFVLCCAKRFHYLLPEDPVLAVESMELAVLELTGAEHCELFAFDETRGVYTSLSDEKAMRVKPRELSGISDNYLSQWLDIPNRPKTKMAHTHLMINNELVGMVAIRFNPKAFKVTGGLEPQNVLETLSPYLALKIARFSQVKQHLILPHQQQVLAELSNRLVSAVDKESIITETLDILWSHLGFGACQYVVLSEILTGNDADATAASQVLKPVQSKSGEGVVLYENNNGRLTSFFHAGLMSKRHVVQDFSSLVSLLSSGWRKSNYLHLTGGQLGDKSLSSVFGVKQVHSALILPIADVQTGKIYATLNVFQTQPVDIANETLDLLTTLMDLVANALGRATVLEKALAMATRDELTGLLNRRGFYERFHAEIERSRRSPNTVSVALIDVDFFKKLNDTHGHINGDYVLKALADTLSDSVRRTDIVSRFGGEEFAILMPDTTPQMAAELLERVRRRIEKAVISGIHGESLSITVSMGLSPVPMPYPNKQKQGPEKPGSEAKKSNVLDRALAPLKSNAQELYRSLGEAVSGVSQRTENNQQQAQIIISQALSQADIALYEVKNTGRNRVLQYSECPSPDKKIEKNGR